MNEWVKLKSVLFLPALFALFCTEVNLPLHARTSAPATCKRGMTKGTQIMMALLIAAGVVGIGGLACSQLKRTKGTGQAATERAFDQAPNVFTVTFPERSTPHSDEHKRSDDRLGPVQETPLRTGLNRDKATPGAPQKPSFRQRSHSDSSIPFNAYLAWSRKPMPVPPLLTQADKERNYTISPAQRRALEEDLADLQPGMKKSLSLQEIRALLGT